MGPKPDAKGKKKKDAPELEGYDVDSMTREQVEVVCYKLQEQMKREREERAFFQLERDKVRAFWEVARRQLEEALLVVQNKEYGRSEVDTERRRVLKFHDMNVKFLRDEYEKSVKFLMEERKRHLKVAEEEYEAQSLLVRKEKRQTEQRVRREAEEQFKRDKDKTLEQLKDVDILVEDHREEFQRLMDHFEEHHAELREALTLKRRVELAEIDERHKLQVDTLQKNHARAINELKNYYNEVTLNNLSLIASLKDSCADAKEGRVRAMQEARTLRAENNKLVGPLQEVREQLADMRRRMTNYHKDKKALERANARTAHAEKAIDELRWQIDELHLRIDMLRSEREHIRDRLEVTEAELRRVAAPERRQPQRVRELRGALQDCEARLHHQMPLPPPSAICKRVGETQPLLEQRNRRIAQLSLEVVRLHRAHDLAQRQLRVHQPSVQLAVERDQAHARRKARASKDKGEGVGRRTSTRSLDAPPSLRPSTVSASFNASLSRITPSPSRISFAAVRDSRASRDRALPAEAVPAPVERYSELYAERLSERRSDQGSTLARARAVAAELLGFGGGRGGGGGESGGGGQSGGGGGGESRGGTGGGGQSGGGGGGQSDGGGDDEDLRFSQTRRRHTP